MIIEAGTYLENVLVNKPGLTLDGVSGVPTDVAIDPLLGDGITVSEDNVTIRDLRVTGAPTASRRVASPACPWTTFRRTSTRSPA